MQSFRFGQWRVDPATNTVSHGDLRRQLEPRAMDVLLYLCQRPHEVVPAEELLDACWGNNLHGDNAVHKIIAQLRRALGDSSGESRYIETIRKRGYRVLAELAYEAEAVSGSWQQGSPFRGLEAFDEEHAAVFFGRQQAVKQLVEALAAQVRAACAMVLVLGPSGSGKTSLIRAGLVPQLMGGAEGLPALSCSLYLDCADAGSASLFQALASVLLDAELDGRLVFERDSAASLAERLETDLPAVLARLHEAGGGALRLLLHVDRFEAVFRLAQVDDAARAAFIRTLDALARCGSTLLVLACRNDFYPHLAAHPELMSLKLRGGHFDLIPPNGVEMAHIIRQPARAAQLHFGQDPATGAALDDVLIDAAKASPDALPLLQYCLQELYRQRGPDGELSFAVFRDLGGIEGALGRRAEQLLQDLTPVQQAALPKVLAQLVSVAEDELAVTSRRVPWSALDSAAEQELVKAFVDARLLVSDLAAGVPAFGIAHEALLRRWPRAAEWIEQHRQALQVRTRLREQARRWEAQGRARDLLLPPGSQTRQARELMEDGRIALDGQEQDFVRASLQRARLGERVRLAVLSVVVGLGLLAGGLGLVARHAQQQAEAHRSEAEGLMGFMLGEFVEKLRPLGRLDLLDSVSARALSYLSGTRGSEADATTLAQRAKALQLISEVKIARGDPAGANTALLAAHDILQRELALAPRDKGLLKSAGENAFYLGQMAVDQSRYPEAAAYFGAYLGFADRLAEVDSASGVIEQSYAHSSLGSVAQLQGDARRAADEFARSVALKEKALARDPHSEVLIADLANSVSWQASAHEVLGELDQAARVYERENSLLQALHEQRPASAKWTSKLAWALNHRAQVQAATGNLAGARDSYARAAALLGSIVEQDPSNLLWQRSLVAVQIHRYDLDAGALAPGAALARLNALSSQLATLAAKDAKSVKVQQMAASVMAREAGLRLRMGDAAWAARALTPALTTLDTLYAKSQTDRVLRDAWVEAQLLQVDVDRARRDAAAASARCRRVSAVLSKNGDSQDPHILAPLVRTQACLGDSAGAAAAQKRLDAMHYREPDYLHLTLKGSI